MRAVTIDSDLATLFTFTPRKTPITPIQGVPADAKWHCVQGAFRIPRPCDGGWPLQCRQHVFH